MTDGGDSKTGFFTPSRHIWLAITRHRLAASLAADSENPNKLAPVDADVARASAEKLTAGVIALRKLSDGEVVDEHILAVLQAMEALEARAPLDETPRRVFARQRASAAGRGSGAARNKKADSGWRTHAVELARQRRREAPSLSQDSLAAAIEADWQLAGVKPAHETLRKFIASEEKAGRLRPKTKTPPKKLVAN